MTNIVARSSHCVTRTESNPICWYHMKSAYREAKMKNPTSSTAMMTKEMVTTRRVVRGAAGFEEVVVTHPS